MKRASASDSDAHLNLRNGNHKRLIEGTLFGIVALYALYGICMTYFPPPMPLWLQLLVMATLFGLLFPTRRLYESMLSFQRGEAVEVDVDGLDPGRYYEMLGQAQVDPGLIEARVRKRGVKSSMFIRFEYTPGRLDNDEIPQYFIVTPGGRYDLRSVKQVEFEFDPTDTSQVEARRQEPGVAAAA